MGCSTLKIVRKRLHPMKTGERAAGSKVWQAGLVRALLGRIAPRPPGPPPGRHKWSGCDRPVKILTKMQRSNSEPGQLAGKLVLHWMSGRWLRRRWRTN